MHVLALQHLLDGGETIAVNLASGRGASVQEVIKSACAVTGAKIAVRKSPLRPGDPPVLVGRQSARTLLPLSVTPGADKNRFRNRQ